MSETHTTPQPPTTQAASTPGQRLDALLGPFMASRQEIQQTLASYHRQLLEIRAALEEAKEQAEALDAEMIASVRAAAQSDPILRALLFPTSEGQPSSTPTESARQVEETKTPAVATPEPETAEVETHEAVTEPVVEAPEPMQATVASPTPQEPPLAPGPKREAAPMVDAPPTQAAPVDEAVEAASDIAAQEAVAEPETAAEEPGAAAEAVEEASEPDDLSFEFDFEAPDAVVAEDDVSVTKPTQVDAD